MSFVEKWFSGFGCYHENGLFKRNETYLTLKKTALKITNLAFKKKHIKINKPRTSIIKTKHFHHRFGKNIVDIQETTIIQKQTITISNVRGWLRCAKSGLREFLFPTCSSQIFTILWKSIAPRLRLSTHNMRDEKTALTHELLLGDGSSLSRFIYKPDISS